MNRTPAFPSLLATCVSLLLVAGCTGTAGQATPVAVTTAATSAAMSSSAATSEAATTATAASSTAVSSSAATTAAPPDPLSPEGSLLTIATGGDLPGLWVSQDGLTWASAWTMPGTWTALAATPERVVVGGVEGAGGVVRTYEDGEWSGTVSIDLGLAALGTDGTEFFGAGVDGAGQIRIQRSVDGVDWQDIDAQLPELTGPALLGSLTHGQGRWLLTVDTLSDTGRPSREATRIWSSPDGVVWTDTSIDTLMVAGQTVSGLAIGAGPQGWVATGISSAEMTDGLTPIAATSTDAVTWASTVASPSDMYVVSPAWAGDFGWVAIGGIKAGWTGAGSDFALYTSKDGLTWQRGTALPEVAWSPVVRAYVEIPSVEAPPPSSTPPAAPAAVVDGDLGLSRPMVRPACDGTIAVFVFAATDPATAATEIESMLAAFPSGSYLRTDRACASLTQVSAQGTPIYAVYQAFSTVEEACRFRAGVGEDGYPDAYGRYLSDDLTPENSLLQC